MKKSSIKDISIKQKLILIILSISVFALLLACSAFILFDRVRFKKKMVQELEIIADIIGNNCKAALLFNIQRDAQETILSLKAHKHIVSACIYDTSNQQFAQYIKPGSNIADIDLLYQRALHNFGYIKTPISSILPLLFNIQKENIHYFYQNHLILFHPIILDNERIGTVYLQSDMQELALRSRQFLGIIGFILAGTLIIIFSLTARFQRLISVPIIHLTQTARHVIIKKDYSIRAVKKYNDEIGFLIDNFNDMLTRIENRDKALGNASEELQKKTVQLKQELKERRRAEKRIKASLTEKEILLQEIHHRVKNNLQIISSLLNLQMNDIHDDTIISLFRDCHNRVRTMALIHEQLYQSKDITKIDFGEYIRNLTVHLFNIYRKPGCKIDLNIDVNNVSFSLDTAIPCGLLINELVSNSLKYAFPTNHDGKIKIILKANKKFPKSEPDGHKYKLVVSDNGIGIPKHINYRTAKSLGLKLVHVLVKQLNGSIHLNRKKGTTFTITFNEI